MNLKIMKQEAQVATIICHLDTKKRRKWASCRNSTGGDEGGARSGGIIGGYGGGGANGGLGGEKGSGIRGGE